MKNQGKKRKKITPKPDNHRWLILLLIIFLFLRLPSLFEPVANFDEAIYLTLGQAVREGAVLYRDIFDHKPPLIYLLAALSSRFGYYRFIFFLWSLVTIFFFYRLTKLIFPRNKQAIKAITIIFTLLTSLHTFEGNIANAENFMMLPTIGGVILILKGLDLGRLRTVYPGLKKKLSAHHPDSPGNLMFFTAGVLFSLAALFKIPAAFDFIAILVFLLLILFEKKKKNYSLPALPAGRFAIRYSLLLLGFSLPILTSLIYYATKGALHDYLTAAFFQNIPYLSSWSSGQHQIVNLPLPLLFRSLIVLTLMIMLFPTSKKISPAVKLIFPWFAFSWLAALLPARPYPHYLLQLLPAFCLSLGLLGGKNLSEKAVPFFLTIAFILTFNLFHFWRYANLPYYLNFYQYVLGQKSQKEYFLTFNSQTERIYQIAAYLKTHTLPGEKIFIWGNDPFLYTLSERLPVGRYLTAYHIIDFQGETETLQLLKKKPPRYLLFNSEESYSSELLNQLIRDGYFWETEIGPIQFFHRRF